MAGARIGQCARRIERPVQRLRHIALEGRCYVLTACQHLRRSAYPDDFECALGDAPDTVLMRGGSAIIGPLGEVLAGPDFSDETILRFIAFEQPEVSTDAEPFSLVAPDPVRYPTVGNLYGQIADAIRRFDEDWLFIDPEATS